MTDREGLLRHVDRLKAKIDAIEPLERMLRTQGLPGDNVSSIAKRIAETDPHAGEQLLQLAWSMVEKRLEIGTTASFAVTFDFNSSELNRDAIGSLDTMATRFRATSGRNMCLIHGHHYEMEPARMASARAENVRAFLEPIIGKYVEVRIWPHACDEACESERRFAHLTQRVDVEMTLRPDLFCIGAVSYGLDSLRRAHECYRNQLNQDVLRDGWRQEVQP